MEMQFYNVVTAWCKKICFNDFLYKQEVKKLCSLFQRNGYPNSFINKVIEKFNGNSKPKKYEKDFLFTIGIPYCGKTFDQFAKGLADLIKLKFNIDINVYFTTMKTASYFSLQCNTPFALFLLSNVVYKFTYSCDANNAYISMTTRHIDTRVKKHLHSKNTKSAIHDHIKDCKTCLETKYDLNNFQVLRQCTTKYKTKIQEALLIKKHNPKLNAQLYGGSSILLNVF